MLDVIALFLAINIWLLKIYPFWINHTVIANFEFWSAMTSYVYEIFLIFASKLTIEEGMETAEVLLLS